MDCDDQVRFVKRDHDPHPLAPNVSDIPPVAVRVQVDILGIRNQLLSIGDSRTDITGPILRMSCEAHIGLSLQRANLFPLSTRRRRDLDRLASREPVGLG